MTNVPQGVWIDENGRIVRAAESAGAYDMVHHMNRATFEIPDDAAEAGIAIRDLYINALRDWVRKGASSAYALPANEVRRRMRGPSEADVRAATHVHIGRYLYGKGAIEGAKFHFKEAVRLCPDSWNYRRQSNMLDPQSIGELNAGPDFWEAIDALGGKAFYPAADFSSAG